MNIILITLEYPPFKGGVANYYGNLVKHWPAADRITVLDNEDGALLSGKIALKWLPSIAKLFREAKRGANHILVGNLLPLGTAAYLVSMILKIDYSVILHGMDFEYAIKKRHKKFLTRLILGKAKNIICVNSYVASKVTAFMRNQNKIIVANPGINPDTSINLALRSELIKKYSLEGKTVFLSIGRMVRRKGFDKAIEAFRQIANPDYIYFVCGKGPDKDFIQAAARGAKNIIFLENLSGEEKWGWFAACDCFVMPSRNIDGDVEGFGIVYLEANLAGKPVIAGRSGGVGDAVIDGVNGLMVEPSDIEDIKKAMLKIARDEGLRRQLGEAGKARAIKDFDWRLLIGDLRNKLFNQT